MAQRGAYAKGIAKREEILTTALEVIVREGFSGASVRQLADAVGLSQAGLLHYFASKDELFTEVLRKRDEVDAVGMDAAGPDPAALFDGFLALIRHNADVPGLVQLYVHLSAAATDPAHDGHEYFRERVAQIRSRFAPAIAELQASGDLPSSLEPEQLSRILIALADGLQEQWLMDPSIDMAGDIAALLQALGLRSPAAAR